MRALGLWQPWAAFVRLGYKRIETRYWNTDFRGKVLFCSTKKVDPNASNILERVRSLGFDVSDDVLKDLGTMQCTVDLIDCRPGNKEDEQLALCPLYEDIGGAMFRKHSLVLSNVVPVVQKPVKCGRRWFTVQDSHVEQDMAFLAKSLWKELEQKNLDVLVAVGVRHAGIVVYVSQKSKKLDLVPKTWCDAGVEIVVNGEVRPL